MTDLAQRVAAHPGWYHTIDLAPGLTTPGFCDLRPVAPDVVPTAAVAGKRCLDVGTFDGFWAFELESRGAAEVFALDLPDGTRADWPPNTRAQNEAVSRESGPTWPHCAAGRRPPGSRRRAAGRARTARCAAPAATTGSSRCASGATERL